MQKLLSQLHVLRCIAHFRPHAHLAFLFHAPYRAMYGNQGQNIELCEFYGQWIYNIETWYQMEKVFHILPHNKKIYHPLFCVISKDSRAWDGPIIFLVKDACHSTYYLSKYNIYTLEHLWSQRNTLQRIKKKDDEEKFNDTLQTLYHYKARALQIK